MNLLLRQGMEGKSVAQASGSVRQTMENSGVGIESVTGLGEAALWGGNQLHVFTSAWYLIITPDPAAGLDQARALAGQALSRLQP